MKNFEQEIFTSESGVKELLCMESSYTSLTEKDKYFKSVKVDTIEEFDAIIEHCLTCKELAFRGVKEAKFRLQTSGQIAYKIKCERLLAQPTKKSYQDFLFSNLSLIKNNTRIRRILKEQELPINDVLYFALLQHYGYPSPLLDFSYNLQSALFFMLDGLKMSEKNDTNNDINNYCSLYIIKYTDPEFGSIQNVNKFGAQRADNMVEDALAKGYKVVGLSAQATNDFLELPYDTYKDIYYFGVQGSSLGTTKIDIPSLGFTASYNINNPRISAQAGMFIFIGNAFKSLEHSVNEQSGRQHIMVINVNKNLAPFIRDKYLKDIKRTVIYPKDKISRRIICSLRCTPHLYSMDFYNSGMSWSRYWQRKIKNALHNKNKK